MASLAAITGQEVEIISRFVALLSDEQEALKKGEASALPEIGSAKVALVDQLNELEKTRCAALGIGEGANTRDVMSQWLSEHPEQQVASANWEKLLGLASEAKQLHELNAKLVALHLQRTTETLAILTRQFQQNTLYGSNGQTALSSGSRIVDSA